MTQTRTNDRTDFAAKRISTKLHRIALMISGIAVAAIMMNAVPAQAQQSGTDRALVVQELQQRHAESPAGMGIANNGGLVELFTSKDGSTWTLIMTLPNGKSFLIGSGETWAQKLPEPDGPKI